MSEDTILKFSAGTHLNYLKNLTQNKRQLLNKQKSPCICAYLSAKWDFNPRFLTERNRKWYFCDSDEVHFDWIWIRQQGSGSGAPILAVQIKWGFSLRGVPAVRSASQHRNTGSSLARSEAASPSQPSRLSHLQAWWWHSGGPSRCRCRWGRRSHPLLPSRGELHARPMLVPFFPLSDWPTNKRTETWYFPFPSQFMFIRSTHTK